jgi:hypothetical protein
LIFANFPRKSFSTGTGFIASWLKLTHYWQVVLRRIETDAQEVRLASLNKSDAINERAFRDSHLCDDPRCSLNAIAIHDRDNGANDQLAIYVNRRSM